VRQNRIRALFLALLFFVFASPLEAYTVYLKNGSAIRSVATYEKVDGTLMLHISGGKVGVPVEDVQRIEGEGGAPPLPDLGGVAPSAPPPPQVPARREEQEDAGKRALRQRLSEIDKRLSEIRKREDAEAEIKEEHRKARLRIEVLWQKGRKAALDAGKTEAEWFLHLNEQERQWAQLNLLKKRKLDGELEALGREMETLRSEKEGLLKEKQSIEERLK
jgi:hypothetical protein